MNTVLSRWQGHSASLILALRVVCFLCGALLSFTLISRVQTEAVFNRPVVREPAIRYAEPQTLSLTPQQLDMQPATMAQCEPPAASDSYMKELLEVLGYCQP